MKKTPRSISKYLNYKRYQYLGRYIWFYEKGSRIAPPYPIIYYRMCTSVVTQYNHCPYNGNHKLIPIWLFVLGYIKITLTQALYIEVLGHLAALEALSLPCK